VIDALVARIVEQLLLARVVRVLVPELPHRPRRQIQVAAEERDHAALTAIAVWMRRGVALGIAGRAAVPRARDRELVRRKILRRTDARRRIRILAPRVDQIAEVVQRRERQREVDIDVGFARELDGAVLVHVDRHDLVIDMKPPTGPGIEPVTARRRRMGFAGESFAKNSGDSARSGPRIFISSWPCSVPIVGPGLVSMPVARPVVSDADPRVLAMAAIATGAGMSAPLVSSPREAGTNSTGIVGAASWIVTSRGGLATTGSSSCVNDHQLRPPTRIACTTTEPAIADEPERMGPWTGDRWSPVAFDAVWRSRYDRMWRASYIGPPTPP